MESCVLVFPGKPGLKHSADITSQDIFFFEICDAKFSCNNQVLQQENWQSKIVDAIWLKNIDLASISRFITLFAKQIRNNKETIHPNTIPTFFFQRDG